MRKRQHIFLYQDLGVDRSLCKKLHAQLSRNDECTFISAQEVIKTKWNEHADLFVIPGGRDLPYGQMLKEEGTESIRGYVVSGGRFLGICAGAYFSSSYVEFDKGGPLHVEGERKLKFFSGKAIGPLFGPFHYNSEKGSKILSIAYQDENEQFVSPCYYNGGCFFEGKASPLHKVLAIYENGLPSILRCEVGRGLAIVSGVHFENPLSFLEDEKKRVRLMSAILKQLI